MLTSREAISRYWQPILDTIQDGLMIISPTGEIIFVNRAAEVITGYKSEELVGKSCTVLECTGCNIFARGPGPEWCELFVVGNVESKRCQVKGKQVNNIHVLKRATILKDETGELIGAVESLTDISEVVHKEEEIRKLRQTLLREDGFHGIIGKSEAMRRVFDLIEDAARSDAAVMIQGESGTGKELVARAIHELSPRRGKPFVKVDCVTLNENVLESELFGHVKGSFTGADKSRIGRFETAEGGHVFLDEIGDVSPSTQVKLLRVLEEKIIERVGGNNPIRVDVRVITATNRNLPHLLEKGLFREDLYYRINVIPIHLPSLKTRREDIPLLARNFADHLAAKTGQPIDGFTPEAMARLYEHPWPGNVRELKNAVEYAFVVCRGGLIAPEHLPDSVNRPVPPPAPARNINRALPYAPPGRDETPEDQGKPIGIDRLPDEREQLIRALQESGGNQSEAARLLGVSRMTVWKRLKKHNINISRDIS